MTKVAIAVTDSNTVKLWCLQVEFEHARFLEKAQVSPAKHNLSYMSTSDNADIKHIVTGWFSWQGCHGQVP